MLKELLVIIFVLIVIGGILYLAGVFKPAAPEEEGGGNATPAGGGGAGGNKTPDGGVSYISIAVIGSFDGSGSADPSMVTAPLLKQWLDGAAKKEGVSYSVVNPSHFAQVIDDYDVLLVTGERQVDEALVGQINQQAGEGKPIIVIGDAAVKLPNVTYIGWRRLSGAGATYVDHTFTFMPVEKNTDRDFELTGVAARVLDRTHGIVTLPAIEEDDLLDCSQLDAYDVAPVSGGHVLTTFSGDYQGRQQTVMGFVESADGKVQYYSYDPGCTPDFLLNALRVLAA